MTECRFPKMLESPEMLCARSLPVTEATDGWLKSVVLWTPLSSFELVGWPSLLASGFLDKSRCIPWQRLLAAVAADNSVELIWMWYWSS